MAERKFKQLSKTIKVPCRAPGCEKEIFAQNYPDHLKSCHPCEDPQDKRTKGQSKLSFRPKQNKSTSLAGSGSSGPASDLATVVGPGVFSTSSAEGHVSMEESFPESEIDHEEDVSEHLDRNRNRKMFRGRSAMSRESRSRSPLQKASHR